MQALHTSESAEKNKVVQGLWIGPELSTMERMSIRSFLKNGHDYHLYVYDVPRSIPAGTVVKDANEILPASTIFRHTDTGSYGVFADYFRYKLLLERGGWWVDTDLICLKPFDFTADYVFASEAMEGGGEMATNGIIKVSAHNEFIAHVWRCCREKDGANLPWGETGPALMSQAVSQFALEAYRQRPEVFCPLPPWEWDRVLDPHAKLRFGEEARAVHLWNEMWRRGAKHKDQKYPPGCLYERLKALYLAE